MAGAGNQIHVTAALADCGGVCRRGVRDVEVTCFNALLDHRQHQVTPLGALARIALQQPLATGKPAARAAHLATHEQAKAEPEIRSGRLERTGHRRYARCGHAQACRDIHRPDQPGTPPSQAARGPRLLAALPDRRVTAPGRPRSRRAARSKCGLGRAGGSRPFGQLPFMRLVRPAPRGAVYPVGTLAANKRKRHQLPRRDQRMADSPVT